MIFLFYLSISGGFFINAQERNYNNLVIFVDSKNQIPKERALRKAYFNLLLDYNKALIDGSWSYFDLLYGTNFRFTNKDRNEDEVNREELNDLATAIANDSVFIIIQDNYSREELFEYSHMSEQLTEFFNELFE